MKTLKETNLFPEEHKELIEDFLLGWASFAVKQGSDSYMLIKEMLGDEKEAFENKVKEFMKGESVLEYLQKLKRYGHREQTSQELIEHFKPKLSPASFYAQLVNLLKWKEIKKETIKLGKHKVIFYSAV